MDFKITPKKSSCIILAVYLFIYLFIYLALVGVAQWIEHRPENQRVDGSIPSQDTCLGCGPGPQ